MCFGVFTSLFLLTLFAAPGGLVPAQDLRFDSHNLPEGWILERETTLDPRAVGALQLRLGVHLADVRYQFLDVRGLKLQVNLLTAANDTESESLVKAIATSRGAEFVARKGATVVEFAKMSSLSAKACRHEMGLAPEPEATWRMSFRVACVGTLDYMEQNQVFNLCVAADREPANEQVEAEIRSLIADWTLCDTLRLRAPGPGFDAKYSFIPAPIEVREEGATTLYRFKDLPVSHGLPYVRVTAAIRVPERFEPIDGTCGANLPAPRWAIEDANGRALVARLMEGRTTERERLLAVFDYVVRHIDFGGPVKGSRYGVARVLAQGYGHCWDKSDAFVALCRAAGLRVRQTAGWLQASNEGHVWAEVYLKGEGWLPVDTTCPWLGTSADYVPVFLSEDGEMPIVYLSLPRLERI
jgi:hypothetical protein